MSRELKIENFDPNGVGVHNDHFIGLPFEAQDAQVILIPAAWDLTVSSGAGTHGGPQNILEASYQLDLFDDFVDNAWQLGIFMQGPDRKMQIQNDQLRPLAENYIAALESHQEISEELERDVVKVNLACAEMLEQLSTKCQVILAEKKYFGIIGGDHSVALAGIRACAMQHEEIGILQFDAHMDLRQAYEGFTYSHASIFYNAMQLDNVSKLVQVGIRDYCQAEYDFSIKNKDRIEVFTDTRIQEQIFKGIHFDQVAEDIVSHLPDHVYISFDIDGLTPEYCQHTGTPVPGGLSFNQAKYLLKKVVQSGRKIIGFDLCEVAGKGNKYDGNVGARLAYILSNYMGKSQGLI